MKKPPSYEQFNKWIQEQGIKSEGEFRRFDKSKLPPGYPKNPRGFYKRRGTWINTEDLLGIRSNFWPGLKNPPSYEEFKKWIRKRGIKSQGEFRKFDRAKFPPGYSKHPDRFYKRQGTWEGWNELCGTKSHYLTNTPSYEEYKKYIQKLGIKSQVEFNKIRKSKFPPNYPKNPSRFYERQGKWKGWNDLFGTESHFITSAPSYEEYKKWLHTHGIKTQKEFRKFDKSELPPNYPKEPFQFYKRQGTWKGWNEFCGTKSHLITNAPSYEEYKKWVQKLGIKTGDEFKKYDKSEFPPNYPKEPARFYKRQGTWISWGDFIGSGYVALRYREYRSFDEARKYAHSLKFKNHAEWINHVKSGKLPKDIPQAPFQFYKTQGTWTSFGDFLGTGTIAPQIRSKNYLRWPEAKKEYRKLAKQYNLKNSTDWWRFTKTHVRLLNKLKIPASPRIIYTKEKVWRKMKK